MNVSQAVLRIPGSGTEQQRQLPDVALYMNVAQPAAEAAVAQADAVLKVEPRFLYSDEHLAFARRSTYELGGGGDGGRGDGGGGGHPPKRHV